MSETAAAAFRLALAHRECSMRYMLGMIIDAYWRFIDDDGWAIASHVALSALMSLFPFLIFVTALAGFFGSRSLADEVARILFEAWPREAAAPIVSQLHLVLSQSRRDLLTVGVLLALWFSSSGVEALRVALNRAYGSKEPRSWWVLRLESMVYVLLGSFTLLALAFLFVLGPFLWAPIVRHVPTLAPFSGLVSVARYVVATVVIVAALGIAHAYLPFERRSLRQIAPGVTVTLMLMLSCGFGFATYLTRFGQNYVATYAGLASAMIALIFLYAVAAIFIFGAELNAAIARVAKPGVQDHQA
jgi:membrane protein